MECFKPGRGGEDGKTGYATPGGHLANGIFYIRIRGVQLYGEITSDITASLNIMCGSSGDA